VPFCFLPSAPPVQPLQRSSLVEGFAASLLTSNDRHGAQLAYLLPSTRDAPGLEPGNRGVGIALLDRLSVGFGRTVANALNIARSRTLSV